MENIQLSEDMLALLIGATASFGLLLFVRITSKNVKKVIEETTSDES